MSDNDRFTNIGFDDFKELAKDKTLTKYEKIGFPDLYREQYEEHIFNDIRKKITNIDNERQLVLDIGPGCSDLPIMLIDVCRANSNNLLLVDCEEMLDLLPDDPCVEKTVALYPDCPELIKKHSGRVDAILCYSVLHYIFIDVAFFKFIDLSLQLLAPGGQFLIGDIPNVSKRRRFFSSETGVAFHQEYMKTSEEPEVKFHDIEYDQIDDSIVMAILQRARLAGFDAYVVPQDKLLPMANRREDILIIRP